MGDIIAKIELISRLTDALLDSKVAKAVGAFIGTNLLDRGELTPEQHAEVVRVLASYAGMRAQLESEIAADNDQA